MVTGAKPPKENNADIVAALNDLREGVASVIDCLAFIDEKLARMQVLVLEKELNKKGVKTCQK